MPCALEVLIDTVRRLEHGELSTLKGFDFARPSSLDRERTQVPAQAIACGRTPTSSPTTCAPTPPSFRLYHPNNEAGPSRTDEPPIAGTA